MKCPHCKTELKKGKPKAYETLCEHVMNPNSEEFILRATYYCPNRCGGKDAFYGINGGRYNGDFSVPCLDAILD